MPLDGALVVRVTDIYGQAITQAVDISVSRRDGPVVFREPKADFSHPLAIVGLGQGPGALFKITVDAPSYWPVSAFVNLPAAGVEVTLSLPFRPDAVHTIRFAEYVALPSEARALVDIATYTALDNERKAGLLNILAKSAKTVLPDGRTVLSYLTRVIRAEQDRIFAEVAPELTDAAKRAAGAGAFRLVPSSMHTPPVGYVRGASYKTKERFGNLQLTLFHSTGQPTIADIDIDNAAGLKHVFQVIGNAAHGPTHPYDIQAILIASQQLDTYYTLVAG